MGKVDMDGESIKALMVDSDAKGAKEHSMYEQACKRYEEGLEAIKGKRHQISPEIEEV